MRRLRVHCANLADAECRIVADMAKTYVGARLRRLRADLGISQAALARRIDMSTTYVNQLENNQRPLTVPVLLTLTSTFDLAADYFADAGDARLSADIADALLAHGEEADRAEITELVSRMPSVGRTLVNLHRRLSAATAELEDQQSAGTAPLDVPVTPFEQVRDYFYDRRNHIAELDSAAEQLFRDEGFDRRPRLAVGEASLRRLRRPRADRLGH